MKKVTILLLSAILSIASTYSQMFTIEGSSTEYSTLQAVIDAASAGNIINCPDGYVSSVHTILDKQLHFKGSGYSGDSVASMHYFTVNADASGSSFEGLFFKKIYIGETGTDTTSNILITNCRLEIDLAPRYGPSANITVSSSVISRVDQYSGSSVSNYVIKNTIFTGWQNHTINNATYTNCIFLGFGEGSRILGDNVIVENSIIRGLNTFYWAQTGITNSIFRNNFFGYTMANRSANSFDSTHNVTGVNNYILSDANMPNVFVDADAGGINVWAVEKNYHLNSTGPAALATGNVVGTDLKEVGVYGGDGLNGETGGGTPVTPMAEWDNTENSNLYTDGNVSIGTDNMYEDPDNQEDYALTVNGKMFATEIRVLHSPWPDYVFKEGYSVISLDSLQNYTSKHKHLPNVPSEEEVESRGISVAKMNAILLEKIEELTLYLFELNAQRKVSDARIEALEMEVKALQGE